MELTNIVTILIITVFVFLVLLILGVRKSFKLKAENERLSKEHTEEDEKKDYEDFTEGHLY
jgi:septal ring-binding cell division protein DamX